MRYEDDGVVQACMLARRFKYRMLHLMHKADEDLITRVDEWDPYATGYYVLGEDDMLLTNLELVYFILRFDLGGEGIPSEDYDRVIDAMRRRQHHDERNRGYKTRKGPVKAPLRWVPEPGHPGFQVLDTRT